MNRKLIMLSIATAGILLTGCGGGGGGSTTAPNQVISGNVVDGPIKDSRVTVNCSGGNYGPVITNASGAFTISNIGSNINLETCTINAVGGNDGVNDFTGLTLKAPYKLAGTKTGINVTPITTLVANHDGDIEEAKTAISGFLNVDVNKLKENPNKDGNIALLRKAMMLTKIAQKQGKFLDIDGQKNQNNPISGDIDDLISGLDTELKDTIDAIKDSNLDSIAKIEKKVSQRNVFNALKDAYKLNSFETNQKENLMYLASKIVEANKKDNKYQVVSKHHIRKALTDAGLTPKFADDNYTTLHDDIKNELVKSQADFKTLIDGKTITISDIKDFVLFDANTYEQIVGNDQNARRNYYAYSNKSNISNTLSLIDKNSFTEQNDSINEYAGRGLAKIGFSDEAIDFIKTTILIPENRFNALNWLGDDLIDNGDNKNALIALDNAFNQFKANRVGKEKDTSGNDINNIMGTIDRLELINEKEKAEEVINHVLTIVQKSENGYSYDETTKKFDKKSLSLFTEKNNKDEAKNYALNASNLALKTPLIYFGNDNTSFARKANLRQAIHGSFFGLTQESKNNLDEAKKYKDTLTEDFDIKQFNNIEFVYNALNSNDINETVKKFNQINEETDKLSKKDILNLGFAAILASNGKRTELFNYYKNENIYSNKKDISSNIFPKMKENISTSIGVKLLASQEDYKAYLDDMLALIKTWTITKDSDARAIYANWSDSTKSYDYNEGYLALAQEYTRLGDSKTAKEILNDAITKVKDFTEASEFRKGIQNIIWASKDLNIDITSNISPLIKTLIESSLKTSSKSDISSLISNAKLIVSYDRKNALKILEHAETLVPALDTNAQDIAKSVEMRLNYLVGKKTYSGTLYYKYSSSIAAAYAQISQKNESARIIKLALTDLEKIKDADSTYSSLLPRAIVAYAAINKINEVKENLRKIKTVKEKEKAAISVAEALAKYDAFKSNVASIDSDGDTNPDFFAPNATDAEIKASGLKLDDDIDEDGIADISDKLPYDNI